jgi:hypothetical protein
MWQTLQLGPGVFKDDSALSAKGAWIDADKIRFVRGLPQTIGGWESLSAATYEGVARGLFAWRDNAGNPHIALGTHTHLYVYTGGTLVDITPIETSGTLGSDPIRTAAGSQTVTIAHAAHGRSIGSRILIDGASAVGGLVLEGEYTVTGVSDADHFTLRAETAATSDATGGGGAVAFTYLLKPGSADGAAGSGFGTGSYGGGAYGASSGAASFLRSWSFDAWGETLLAMPRGGGLYQWSLTPGARAARITSAPDASTGLFVAPERIVVVYGCAGEAAVTSPLRVRWCDQENLTDWSASAADQAGEFDLAKGTRIVTALPGRGENYILTDTALYAMRYTGDSLVYRFPLIAGGAGCIGAKAACTLGGRLFWMSPDGVFYLYDGSAPKAIPCPIQREIFDHLAPAQGDKIWAAPNAAFGEIWWFYADARDGNEISRYAIYNVNDGSWANGRFDRTAWIDAGAYAHPIAAADGKLYFHERLHTADAQPLAAYIESAAIELGEGDTLMLCRGLMPDFATLIGGISLEVEMRAAPQAGPIISGPFAITATSEIVDFLTTGRQMRLRFASQAAPSKWRLGRLRADLVSTGQTR